MYTGAQLFNHDTRKIYSTLTHETLSKTCEGKAYPCAARRGGRVRVSQRDMNWKRRRSTCSRCCLQKGLICSQRRQNLISELICRWRRQCAVKTQFRALAVETVLYFSGDKRSHRISPEFYLLVFLLSVGFLTKCGTDRGLKFFAAPRKLYRLTRTVIFLEYVVFVF